MDTVFATLLKFLLRRGLTVIGGSAAAISDDQLTQTVGTVLVVGNELFQAWQAHKAEKKKRDGF